MSNNNQETIRYSPYEDLHLDPLEVWAINVLATITEHKRLASLSAVALLLLGSVLVRNGTQIPKDLAVLPISSTPTATSDECVLIADVTKARPQSELDQTTGEFIQVAKQMLLNKLRSGKVSYEVSDFTIVGGEPLKGNVVKEASNTFQFESMPIVVEQLHVGEEVSWIAETDMREPDLTRRFGLRYPAYFTGDPSEAAIPLAVIITPEGHRIVGISYVPLGEKRGDNPWDCFIEPLP